MVQIIKNNLNSLNPLALLHNTIMLSTLLWPSLLGIFVVVVFIKATRCAIAKQESQTTSTSTSYPRQPFHQSWRPNTTHMRKNIQYSCIIINYIPTQCFIQMRRNIQYSCIIINYIGLPIQCFIQLYSISLFLLFNQNIINTEKQ